MFLSNSVDMMKNLHKPYNCNIVKNTISKAVATIRNNIISALELNNNLKLETTEPNGKSII